MLILVIPSGLSRETLAEVIFDYEQGSVLQKSEDPKDEFTQEPQDGELDAKEKDEQDE
jgi:hypothetical protein